MSGHMLVNEGTPTLSFVLYTVCAMKVMKDGSTINIK